MADERDLERLTAQEVRAWLKSPYIRAVFVLVNITNDDYSLVLISKSKAMRMFRGVPSKKLVRAVKNDDLLYIG